MDEDYLEYLLPPPAHLDNSPAPHPPSPPPPPHQPSPSPPPHHHHQPGDNLHLDPSHGAGQQRGAGPSGRRRTVFSLEQKRQLMQRFRRQRYLSPGERAELAASLGLDCKQVKTWYQNRRMKLKRQHPLGWPEPDISPFTGQTLSLDQGLMPDLVKCHIHGCEHSSALCSEEMMGQRSLMEQPFSEPPSVQGNLETHPAGSCFHFQTSPSENHLGDFCQEHLVVPETPPPPFTDPRCGMGRVVSGVAPAPSYMEQLQNPPLSPTYSLTQAELSSLPEVRVRVGTRTTQDIHIYQNGWSSLQSGHCSGYMMITPLLDTYDAESPAYTQSCSHSLVG